MNKDKENNILEAYINTFSRAGRRPDSIYLFCEENDMTEADFFEHFGSFTAIESEIWKKLIVDTIDVIKADEAYLHYGAREKYLAFFFTLFEQIKKHRSFYMLSFDLNDRERLKEAAAQFAVWFDAILDEIDAQNESKLKDLFRPVVRQAARMHLLFMLRYHLKDNSKGFQKSDEAVEKSVNLFFDALESQILTSAYSFMRFVGNELKP